MARKSKIKGNRFELLVAKKIVEAAGPEFSRKDCFRTPLSGGHEFAGASDLVISPALREIFPFCVECKHQKVWRLHHTLEMTVDFRSWHQQVLDACAREGNVRAPLLVIHQQNGPVYAAARAGCLSAQFPWRVEYEVLDERWELVSFDSLLRMISTAASVRRIAGS